jgi:YD repeat-containing protein
MAVAIWYEDIAVADMDRPDYQRETAWSHVRRLAKDWNPHKVGLIQVSQRDGHRYVWDGWHRVLAMRERDPQGSLHAQVTDDLTEAAEARLFAEQDGLDRRVAVGAKLWASHLAGDLRAAELVDALKAYGFRMRGTPLGGQLLEIGYFARRWDGPTEAYRLALAALRDAFGPGDPPRWARQGFVFAGLMLAFYPSNGVPVDDDGMAVALRYAGKRAHALLGSPEQKVRQFRNVLGERYNDRAQTRPKVAYEA